MIQDKDLDQLLASYPVREPQDDSAFMTRLERHLDAVDCARAYYTAEISKQRRHSKTIFIAGLVIGVICASLTMILPSPVDLIALNIKSQFSMLVMTYLPYFLMFICAMSIICGIISIINTKEESSILRKLLPNPSVQR